MTGCAAFSCLSKTKDRRRPVFGGTCKFQQDPYWRDCLLFYEYFHGDKGAGLGASHQTGWTGVIARAMHLFATTSAEQVFELGQKAAIVETESPWGVQMAPLPGAGMRGPKVAV